MEQDSQAGNSQTGPDSTTYAIADLASGIENAILLFPKRKRYFSLSVNRISDPSQGPRVDTVPMKPVLRSGSRWQRYWGGNE